MRSRLGSEPYATVPFRGGRLVHRPPRVSDAASWAATRRADERRLRPVFDDGDGRTWEQSQSELAFVERCTRLRWAAARGRAFPAVLVGVGLGRSEPGRSEPGRSEPGRPEVGDAGQGEAEQEQVLGEFGVDAVDPRTRSGELSSWSSVRLHAPAAVEWAIAAVILASFTARSPLRHVVAPYAQRGKRPLRLLPNLGFVDEVVLTKHRIHSGTATDHHMWVIHNNAAIRERLHRVVHSPIA